MTSRWGILLLLCFTRATMGFQAQSIPPVTPYLVSEQGFSYAQVGWLLGLFSMPGLVLAFAGGVLAARLGDRRVMLYGLAALAAGAELFAWSGGFPTAVSGRLLAGIGFVLVNMLMMKIVTDHFAGRELSTAMGVLMTSWPLGISLALAVLGAVAALAGWRAAVHGTALLAALAWGLCALLLPRAPATAEADAGPARGAWPTRGEVPAIVAVSLMWGLYNAGFTVFLGFAPTLLAAQGLAPAQASAAASVASWVWIASLPLGGLLTDRSGRPIAFILVGSLVAAVLVVALPLLAAPTHLVGTTALIALIGLAFGAPPGAVMALPAQVMRPEVRSVGFGIFYTGNYLLMAGLPPVGGWLLDRTGMAAAPVLFSAALFALMPALLAIVQRLRRVAALPVA